MSSIILIKPEVSYWPDYSTGGTKRWVAWRWSCRECGKKGRVHNHNWNYIRYLGISHGKKFHESVR